MDRAAELEIREALDRLDASMDEAWGSGRLTPESIDAAIKAHRARHPYDPSDPEVLPRRTTWIPPELTA